MRTKLKRKETAAMREDKEKDGAGHEPKSKEMELDESKNNRRSHLYIRIDSQLVKKKTFSDSSVYVIEINGPGIRRRERRRKFSDSREGLTATKRLLDLLSRATVSI